MKKIYKDKKSNNIKFQIVDNYNCFFSEVVANYAIKVYNEQRKNKVQDCLMANYKAIDILKSYGINNSNLDKNLRFILGRCSPVLLVPGLWATKLKVEFDCEGLKTDESDTTLKEIRLYCGESVCKEDKKKEEHPFLLSLYDNAFGIISLLNKNEYSSCLGYIANYYQNKNECPKTGEKNNCFYSKYVKVAYYGGTTDTLKESRCGVEAITNVVQDTVLLPLFIKEIDSFNTISKKLVQKGYKEGFSLGGLPNDYRRYLATNNFAINTFKYQINRLYNNTGKPVIIIAHSYGILLTLTNLLKNQNDIDFMKKIKKFIAMAPPFAGSSLLIDIFFHGFNNFNSYFTEFNIFGQYLMYKSCPIIMELRPKSIASQIFTNSAYRELGNALRGRLEIEKDCKETNCSASKIESKTSNFDKLFKGYFPSLLDSECSYESNIEDNKETLNRKCYTWIYNVGDCPSIITTSVNPSEEKFEKDLYCNKTEKAYFYQGECKDNKINCLDEIYYSEKCPNVYNNRNAVQFLIRRFNDDFSKEYGNINESYFDSHEKIRTGVKNSLEYQKKIDIIKDLPVVPPVDTELLYGAFYPTIASLVLDENDFTKDSTIFKKGGDNTVPTWSSLLTGLKWVYDKNKENLPQKIKLIEYCSRLAKSGQYKYDPNKNQNFAAIGCKCLDKENIYKNIKGCSHAGMLQDDILFEYIFSVVNDPKENVDVTDSKIQQLKTIIKNLIIKEYVTKIFIISL